MVICFEFVPGLSHSMTLFLLTLIQFKSNSHLLFHLWLVDWLAAKKDTQLHGVLDVCQSLWTFFVLFFAANRLSIKTKSRCLILNLPLSKQFTIRVYYGYYVYIYRVLRIYICRYLLCICYILMCIVIYILVYILLDNTITVFCFINIDYICKHNGNFVFYIRRFLF